MLPPATFAYELSILSRCFNLAIYIHWFLTLADARRTVEQGRLGHNSARPHSGFAGRTPEEFIHEVTLK